MDILAYTEKPKRHYTYDSDVSEIIKIFSNNLFEYNPPETLTKYQVENALHSGVAALYKCEVPGSVNYDKWCCTPANPATYLDNNGVPSVITTIGSDYSVSLNVEKDCILLYNTSQKSPDSIIEKYANLIQDIDTTIETIVKWCRVAPIPKVRRDNDIVKYKAVMENILKGELINIVSDNSQLLIPENSKVSDMLDLTQPQAAEKLHFLSELREEVIKRITSLYGIPLSTSAKSVQTLNAELHGMDFYSLFCLFDRYYARKESFERAANFTGHDWNFDFSEIMKHQINDIFNHATKDRCIPNNVSRETNGGVETDEVDNV